MADGILLNVGYRRAHPSLLTCSHRPDRGLARPPRPPPRGECFPCPRADLKIDHRADELRRGLIIFLVLSSSTLGLKLSFRSRYRFFSSLSSLAWSSSFLFRTFLSSSSSGVGRRERRRISFALMMLRSIFLSSSVTW